MRQPHTYKRPISGHPCLVMIKCVCYSGTVQPYQCTAACVNFHWQGDETEQSCHSKQTDTDEHQLRKSIQQQDTPQQYPLHNGRRKLDNRNQSRTHLQRSICTCMLNGVTTLMGSYGAAATLHVPYTSSLRFTVLLAGL